MKALSQCIEAARKAGCPRDQVERFLSANVALQPKQWRGSALARECDLEGGPTHISLGGARGSGKTHWSIAQVFIDDCGRVPDLKFLYLRKVGKSAREQIQDLRREVLHSVPHTYKSQEGVLVRRDNGSRVVLGHFQTDKDIDNYLGLQYDGAMIEEATQLSLRKIRDIGTCVRTSKPADVWRPRTYMTSNPGNIGHSWFKAMFIDPFRKGTETETRHVQATVYDNRHVNPSYRKALEALTGWQRRAWLLGDWDIAAGQYFTTYREDVHAFKGFERIPESWDVWLSLDYGFAHYTAVYLFARTPDGILYVVDEHAGRGMLPSEHDTGIRSMLARHALPENRLRRFVAGTDVFARDHRGECVADAYESLGWTLEPANTDRVNGAATILRRLGQVDPDANPRIEPTLFISRACPRLLESLPLMQHDPHRGEDVLKVNCDEDGLGGDDFYDAARYGIMCAGVGPSIGYAPNPLAGYRG